MSRHFVAQIAVHFFLFFGFLSCQILNQICWFCDFLVFHDFKRCKNLNFFSLQLATLVINIESVLLIAGADNAARFNLGTLTCLFCLNEIDYSKSRLSQKPILVWKISRRWIVRIVRIIVRKRLQIVGTFWVLNRGRVVRHVDDVFRLRRFNLQNWKIKGSYLIVHFSFVKRANPNGHFYRTHLWFLLLRPSRGFSMFFFASLWFKTLWKMRKWEEKSSLKIAR